MTDDPRRLLGGWATDTLTEAERRKLLYAALEDEALFDELVQEDGLRELLDASARQQVIAALDRPARWERLRAWLERPATVADLAVVTATLVAALAAYQLFRAPERGEQPAASRPLPLALSAAAIARLAELPPRETGAAGLAIEGVPAEAPVRLRAGETFTVRLTLRSPARVVLVERRPDGSAVQAWPPPGRPPRLLTRATDGSPLRVPLAATPPAGRHLLRLVAAPADLDLSLLSPAELKEAAARLTVLELPYEVTHP